MLLPLLPFLAGPVALTAADAAPPPDDAPIDEIQVRATRRPAVAGDVSAALTVIEREDLTGVKLVTDALAAEPGVFLQQTTPGQGAAILRGLKGSEVLHLVDGMRLNNAIFRNAPTQYLALVSPATVERIEVLRGSPGSLYGSDAVGGVVQIVNRLPALSSEAPSVEGEVGLTADTAEQQRAVQASVEFGDRRRAALVAANYVDTGNRRVGGGRRIVPSGYSARAFRAALALTRGEGNSWLVDWQYGEQPKTPRVDELVPGFGESDAASSEFFFAPNARHFLHLRHGVESGWFGATWQADLAWQRITDDRISRANDSDVRRLEDNASDLYGATLTASGTHRRGSWVLGAEAYHDEVSSRRRELNLTTGALEDVESRFPDGSTMTQLAVFANADIDVGAGTVVNGGLRFSDVGVELAATELSQPTDVAVSDVSVDLGLRRDLNDSLTLIANASYGFRAPNVFDLGTLGERPGNRFNVPNPQLDSENVLQFDLGLRYRAERWRFDVVAWQLDYEDRITSVLTGDTTADGRDIVQTRNQADAQLSGVESAVHWSLTEAIDARLVVNYTYGRQRQAGGSSEPADRVPPLNGLFGLSMDLAGGWRIDPYFRFADRQARLSDRDRRDSRIDPTGTDGWITANLRATWQPDTNWTLTLEAVNLTDERYRSHGSGVDGPGINLFADLRYLF